MTTYHHNSDTSRDAVDKEIADLKKALKEAIRSANEQERQYSQPKGFRWLIAPLGYLRSSEPAPAPAARRR